jgi:ABC-type multidrug transport system ATPase subunit
MEEYVASNADFVVIRNLTKDYGSFRALDDISFGLKEDEIF